MIFKILSFFINYFLLIVKRELYTISLMLQPLERSETGLANPWKTGPVCIETAESLNKFVADVASAKIRENQSVCKSCYC